MQCRPTLMAPETALDKERSPQATLKGICCLMIFHILIPGAQHAKAPDFPEKMESSEVKTHI